MSKINFSESLFSLGGVEKEFFDWNTFILTVVLSAAGLVSIYSATYESNMSSFFYKQIVATALGFGGMLAVTFLPERVLRWGSFFVYAASIILLVLVLIIGEKVYGTQGWINFGGFTLQPAEVSKVGVLMLLAQYLSRKGVDVRTLRDLAVCAAIVGVPALLIISQPDHGSASVLGAMTLGVIFWAGFESLILLFIIALPIVVILSLKGFWAFLIGWAAISFVVVLMKKRITWTVGVIAILFAIGFGSQMIYENLNMMEHQRARIETFINPGANPRGAGYNVIQSLMAVGSGGFSGKGYLQGTQTQLRYIPMQWTDFIFSVPTEEFGFLGGVIVILLVFGLIMRSVKIASLVESRFSSLVSIGVGSIFLYHALINIGMAIGIMPVMGIPLPLMSYGGTSMVVNLTMIGLLLNGYRNYLRKRLV
ncbi:MAG: rod shape-determining protein RodA [Chloroflexota bacterium]